MVGARPRAGTRPCPCVLPTTTSRVKGRLTQDAGLATRSTGIVENHDLLKVTWEMTTPDGNVAMTGMNILQRNLDGQILRDYILIG